MSISIKSVTLALLTATFIASGILFLRHADTNENFMKMGKRNIVAKTIPQKNLEPLTLHCNRGRLGNQMCSFAVLYGLSVLNGRKMSVLPCNIENLYPFFEINASEVNLTSFRPQNPWKIWSYLRPEDRNIPDDTNIIKGYPYPCSFTFFNHIRHEIKSAFRFRESYQSYAQNLLLHIKGSRTEVTFIGVHVRRGDYVKKIKTGWLWAFSGKEVDHEYFVEATKYFTNKFRNAIFVVVSDDLPWCQKNLKDFGMYIPSSSPGPGHDIAVLTNCNHTIMTYGTFGFWGAYLSGGDTVYFDKFLKPDTRFAKRVFQFEKMYLPEWVGINTTKLGYWKNYVRPQLKKL